MEFTARQIAEVLEGDTVGNPEEIVDRFAKIEEGTIRSLSFLANPKYTHYIYDTESSVVIVNRDFEPEKEVAATLIRVDDAYQSFARLLNWYDSLRTHKKGIESGAFIDSSAVVGENVFVASGAYVGPNVVIEDGVKIFPHCYLGDNVRIGEGSTLYAGVRIEYDCTIGKNCRIHGGVTIGGDGFGFAPNSEETYDKVAQIGNVVVEDNVEIGANTAIDRATLGSTVIKKGVKLDNLIQIAHNVVIGENTVIAAQTGIAGSVKIGKNCMIGGQVGIAGHLNIGDNVKIAAQSGISSDVKEGSILMGSPAFSLKEFRKSYIHFRKLSDLVARIEALESGEK